MAQQFTIPLLTGDYPQRLEDLKDAAYAARDDKITLYANERHPAEILAEEHEALRIEAEEAGLVVTLEAVGRKSWRRLKAAHPVRTEPDVDVDTARVDRRAGVNTDTVEDDLLHASVVEPSEYKCAHDQPDQSAACTVGNGCSTRAAYTKWAGDDLSEGEFQKVLTIAWGLSQTAAVGPKALPSWQTPSDDEN